MSSTSHAVQFILTIDLNMRRMAVKLIPTLLTDEQKDYQKQIALDSLKAKVDGSFFNSTEIETWVYEMLAVEDNLILCVPRNLDKFTAR